MKTQTANRIIAKNIIFPDAPLFDADQIGLFEASCFPETHAANTNEQCIMFIESRLYIGPYRKVSLVVQFDGVHSLRK